MDVTVDSGRFVAWTDDLGVCKIGESGDAFIGLVGEHDVIRVELLKDDAVSMQEIEGLSDMKSNLLESAVDGHKFLARHVFMFDDEVLEGNGLILRQLLNK